MQRTSRASACAAPDPCLGAAPWISPHGDWIRIRSRHGSRNRKCEASLCNQACFGPPPLLGDPTSISEAKIRQYDNATMRLKRQCDRTLGAEPVRRGRGLLLGVPLDGGRVADGGLRRHPAMSRAAPGGTLHRNETGARGLTPPSIPPLARRAAAAAGRADLRAPGLARGVLEHGVRNHNDAMRGALHTMRGGWHQHARPRPPATLHDPP